MEYDREGGLREIRDADNQRTAHRALWWVIAFALAIGIVALVLAIILYVNTMPKAALASTFPRTTAMAFNFSGLCGSTFLVNGSYFKTGNNACLNLPRFTCDCAVGAAATPYGALSRCV